MAGRDGSDSYNERAIYLLVVRNTEVKAVKKMRLWLIVSLTLALLASVAGTDVPALAAVTGKPDLEATVVGSGELTVGQIGAVQVMVQNVGTFSGDVEDPADQAMAMGYLTATGVPLVPPCTTSTGIKATLTSESSSIEVIGGEALLGTLSRGMSVVQPITFQLYVAQNAEPGTYKLDLKLRYQYLKGVDWLNPGGTTPQFDFHWGDRTQDEEISVDIVGTYFSAVVTETQGMRAGATGTITLDITNSGAHEAYDVTAEIVPGSSVSPIGQAGFLGDMPGGSSVTTQLRASVSSKAIAQNSSVDVLISYKDDRDVPRQSLLTTGVMIKAKLDFEVGPVQAEEHLTPGSRAVITIPIVNAGDYEADDAVARINIVNPFATAPFSTSDDTAFIGTLRPGETGLARFSINVDSDALPEPYMLEMQVEYFDSLGNSYASDTIRAAVTVEPPSGLPTWVIVVVAIAGVAFITVMVSIARRRRRKQA
jgi:hypothetical protein